LPFQALQKDIQVNRNDLGFYHLVIKFEEQSDVLLILQFKTSVSLKYSFQLVEHLKKYREFTESQSEQAFELGMTAMPSYLDGFCSRPLKATRDDL
jgi:hypothetical protein